MRISEKLESEAWAEYYAFKIKFPELLVRLKNIQLGVIFGFIK